MRRLIAAALLFAFALAPAAGSAQPGRRPGRAPAQPPAPPAADDPAEGEDEDDDDWEEEEAPRLRPPVLPSPDLDDWDDEDEDEDEPLDGEADTSLEDASDLLARAAPDQADPTRPVWTAPESVFTIHGYMRVRGELQDSFSLGRTDQLPFSFFAPADRGITLPGGCPGAEDASEPCFQGSDRMRFANMRMRLRPTLALSDDVRVHMMVDVLDNMVLGSTPNSTTFRAGEGLGQTGNQYIPGVPLDSFAYTQLPPQAGLNSLQDSILVRRAWAEVVNRDLGILRFGRMGNHWGLGMLFNGGDGIDADFSSDVDRVMAVTRVAGFLFGAAWDFMGEGFIRYPFALNDIPRGASQKDTIRQFTFFAARRLEQEEQRERLRNGDYVLNGGLFFVYRDQGFSSQPSYEASPPAFSLIRRNARTFTLDGWGQFLWRSLRLEVETAVNVGQIDNLSYTADVLAPNRNILQFGFALESEYRVVNDRLGIYLYTGYATGDRDVDGLSRYDDTVTQLGDDRRISHLSFHPNYRVDLILFRNIMGAIGGAWYTRPGISYDFIRSEFGQLLGIRADAIYSRAAQQVQTYGANPNLGLELNGSVYYQSEDGPDFFDGFYAMFQYGILFPLQGLGFVNVPMAPSLDRAQTLRVILGVQF